MGWLAGTRIGSTPHCLILFLVPLVNNFRAKPPASFSISFLICYFLGNFIFIFLVFSSDPSDTFPPPFIHISLRFYSTQDDSQHQRSIYWVRFSSSSVDSPPPPRNESQAAAVVIQVSLWTKITQFGLYVFLPKVENGWNCWIKNQTMLVEICFPFSEAICRDM